MSPDLQAVEDKITVEQMLARAHLNGRQTTVLRKRFGLDDCAMTLREIAEELHLSVERIRQLEARAIRHVRWRCRIKLREPERPSYEPPPPKPKVQPGRPKPVGIWHLPGTIALTCDRCLTNFVSGMQHSLRGPISDDRIKRLREMARAAGWGTEDGDLCPNCFSKIGATHAPADHQRPIHSAG